ncbi:hypothetical protein SDC9_08028 [bioreactor metagenome]|uniref:Uncharacterized protein n=1 Tax=bioreactor metagenome TaxID=1076179 RepID=A0A644T660_9ZZZZ|nr:hypothetical protein [Candidatus Elulimicrobiales bacterium]
MLKKFYKLFPFVLVFSFIFISTASALTVPAGWYNYSVAGTSFSAKACDRPEGAFSGTKNCIADIVTNSALDKVDVSYSDQDLGQTLKLYKDTTSVSTNLLVTSSSNTCTPSTPCVYKDKPSWSASTGLKTRQYIVNDETTDSSAAIYNITLSYAPIGITGLVDGANFTWGNSLPLNKTVNITCTNATNMTLDGVSVGTKNGYTITYPFTNTNSSTNTITKTIVCTNIGGTTNQQTRTFNLPGQISGTITATNCTIANGASTCNSTVSWNTINPGSTISQVTSNYPSAGTVISNTNTNSQSIAIPYSSRAFFLYNGGAKLDEATAVATCATGTSWNAYQGKCTPAPTTTLTGANCTIALGANSCTTTINWSVTNPAGTTAVTSNYPAANTSIGTTHTGSASGVTIPYASRSFWLYNGGVQKATLTVNAQCSSGQWNASLGKCAVVCPTALNQVPSSSGTSCVCNPSTYVKDSTGFCHAPCVDSTWNETTRTCTAPVPSISAAGCTILGNANSCNTTLTWSMTNPVGPTAVTSNYPTANTSIGTTHTGSINIAIPYSSRAFFLYNNSIERAKVIPTATCINGTNWNGSVCACPADTTWDATSKTCKPVIPSLTAPNCTILGNANSCNTTVTWSVTNPISSTALTSNLPAANTVLSTANSGTLTQSVPYSSRSFYLYNNNIERKVVTTSATCITGTTWNGSTCACPAGHLWNATSKTCNKMTGTLTPSATTCSIAAGASSCNVNLAWNTTNPIGTSAVTSPTNDAGTLISTTVATGNTGTKSVAIPYSTRTFFLYNSSIQLASTTVKATCVSGSSWDATAKKCSLPSGTITAPNCTIAYGASNCNTTLTWNTVNPIGTSAVTSNLPAANTTVATGNSGSVTAAVYYPTRSFYLYNNAVERAQITANSTCNPANRTVWDGSKCACPATAPIWDATNGYCRKECYFDQNWNPATNQCENKCAQGLVYVPATDSCENINRQPICTWKDMTFKDVSCDILSYPCSDGTRSTFNVVHQNSAQNKTIQSANSTYQSPNQFLWQDGQLRYDYVCPNNTWTATALKRPYTHFVTFEVSAGQVRKDSTINLSWNVQLPNASCKIVGTSLKDGREMFNSANYQKIRDNLTTPITSVTPGSLNYSRVGDHESLMSGYLKVSESMRFTASCVDTGYSKGYSQLVRDVYVIDEADR